MARKIKEVKMDALRQALNIISNELGVMNIYTVSGERLEDRKEGKPLVFGVNWAAMGTRSVEETQEFIRKLKEATEICEVVNALDIQDRTLEDDEEITKEQFRKEVKIIKYLLPIGDIGFINEWLDK